MEFSKLIEVRVRIRSQEVLSMDLIFLKKSFMNKSEKQRKAWLDLALFSGAFLLIYGLISVYQACGVFTCSNLTVNEIQVTFYQELMMYVGIAIFDASRS